MSGRRLWILIVISGFLLSSCRTHYPEICPDSTPIGLANADEIASDETLPFRFPLDESIIDEQLYFGWFGVSNECPPGKVDCYVYPERLFHAAEDYKRPAGTPVYAMADGIIRFSAPAKGYGWLILIDHPQANIYSLYGHLSPSRWQERAGKEVRRGDLIAYLGDSDENGGSAEQPVETHLHFGIRTGQVSDYPATGEWRYMGGWIKPCPQDVGWLKPSLIITNQKIPPGGFPQPAVPFLNRWGSELLIITLFTSSGAGMFLSMYRKKKHFQLLIPGIYLIAAGIVINRFGLLRSAILPLIGSLLLAGGIYAVIRHPHTAKPEQSLQS